MYNPTQSNPQRARSRILYRFEVSELQPKTNSTTHNRKWNRGKISYKKYKNEKKMYRNTLQSLRMA
jgi:hypothetical protein